MSDEPAHDAEEKRAPTSAETVIDGGQPSDAETRKRKISVDRSDLAPGDRIGPFRLVERIGFGGMGEVWVAEQHEPVRRKVALKCMRRGLGSSQVVSRFESERQALALMDHPGIARIYDAGVLDDDRPWFAMELVRGLPITDFCNQHRLTLAQRIDLFRQVCSAVQHAHHKAILHRDLKPSNILATEHEGGATVKVIDFGIAKAMGASLVDQTLHTRIGQVIGTPAYMSPEQADPFDLSVDVRSDVYSLGVILYELLTGELPYAPSPDRTRRSETSRRDGPQRPSTKVRRTRDRSQTETVVTERQCTDSRQLASRLRGELDWITLKALHPEPGSRYNSPLDLSDDLKRYLRKRPVEAGPPSTLYRLRRFSSRHAFATSALVGVALALIVGSILAGLGLREARRAEARAVVQAETTERVSSFLIGLFEGADPRENRGEEISAREMLDRGVERLHQLDSEPLVRARLLHATAGIYRELGEHDRALELMEEALGIWRAQTDPTGAPAELPIDSVRLLAEYGDTLREDDRPQEAESTLLEVAEILDAHPDTDGHDLAKNWNDLGLVYDQLGRREEAEALHRRSLGMRRRLDGERSESVATSLHNLSLAVDDRRESVALEEQAIDIRRELLGENHPRVASSLVSLGTTLEVLGELEESEEKMREALRIRRQLGVRDERLAHVLGELGWVLYRQRRYDEADEAFREAVDVAENTPGGARQTLAFQTNNWSIPLAEQGRWREAADQLTRSLDVRRELYEPPDAAIHKAEASLAAVLLELGETERARDLVRGALAGYRALGQAETSTFRQVEIQEVRALFLSQAAGVRVDEAARAGEDLISRMEQAGDPVLAIARAQRALGEGLLRAGRLEAAGAALREQEDLLAEHSPNRHTDRALGLASLGDVLKGLGETEPAIEVYSRCLAQFAASVGDRHPRAGDARRALEELAPADREAPPS